MLWVNTYVLCTVQIIKKLTVNACSQPVRAPILNPYVLDRTPVYILCRDAYVSTNTPVATERTGMAIII